MLYYISLFHTDFAGCGARECDFRAMSQNIERGRGGSPDYRYVIQNSLNKQQKQAAFAREIYDWAESCVLAVVLILLVFVFVVRTATVSGSSMVPTLHDRDRLLLQQIGYTDPAYGDIIVIDRTHSGEPPIIKRVIGRAGDVISIDFTIGAVYRNGERLSEAYINEPTATERDVIFPATVPEGRLFVMGDNRNHSLDSRASEIGMVDLRAVMGKAIVRFFPLDQIGGINHDRTK